MKIRQSKQSEKFKIENIHKKAFGPEEGTVIATLVKDLFDDKTAFPLLSLVAEDSGSLVGHILYTNVKITGTKQSVSAQILAPLAVLPGEQNRGIGGRLIEEGLDRLKKENVDLVFVLGHPEYYPRFGFTPAGVLGYEAPYPIPEKNADAWMVQELSEGIIGKATGSVKCAEALDRPEHWRE